MPLAAWQGRASATWPWEDPARRVRIIEVFGESTGGNHAEGTGTCDRLMTTPRSRDRVFMMNNPRAPGGPFENIFIPTQASALIPLVDCRFGNRADGFFGNAGDPLGQSLSAIAYMLDLDDQARGLPPCRYIFVVTGMGGRQIHEMVPGAAPWTGGVQPLVIWDRRTAMLTRARDLALIQWGQQAVVEAEVFIQGFNEFRIGTTQAAYEALLEGGIIAGLNAQIPALFGGQPPPPILIDQVPGDLKGFGNPVSLAQAAVATRNTAGNVYLADVAYGLPVNINDATLAATAHRTARGVVVQAEKLGLALAGLRQGVPPARCRITAVARTGTVVTLTANRPLVLDTSLFPLAPDAGLKLRDPGGASIASVAVAGNAIGVTLTQAPAAGATLEYSYENTAGTVAGATAGVFWTNGEVDTAGLPAATAGAWGNIRAADRATPSIFAPGFTIRDWLEIGQWTIA
jgi:hypothetical protein